jgi:hypothetical protein
MEENKIISLYNSTLIQKLVEDNVHMMNELSAEKYTVASLRLLLEAAGAEIKRLEKLAPKRGRGRPRKVKP